MTETRVRPLRRTEYDVLITHGAFDEGERVQLLDGELVVVSPQGVPHASVVEALNEMLMPARPRGTAPDWSAARAADGSLRRDAPPAQRRHGGQEGAARGDDQ